MSSLTVVILIVCFASIALADDFKTTDGKEYKNVTVSRVEPDGIVLSSKSGISKVYFAELPKEVQQRFSYDPEKAAAYSAEQNSAQEQFRKQQEEALRQKAEATAKNNQQAGAQIAAADATSKQRQNAQTLKARYAELQQQEDDLLRRIGEIENLPEYLNQHSGSGRYWRNYSYKNPARADLPSLHSHLDDVRREKGQVGQQLEQAQH
jgi:chromosome segregation ATPase